MNRTAPPPRPVMLATDLDGTLIPLDDNAQNRIDLGQIVDELGRAGMTLVFVTGRHLELVEDATRRHGLPHPAWLICDVGTSIYRGDGVDESGGSDRTEGLDRADGDEPEPLDGLRPSSAYVEHLAEIVDAWDVERLHELLAEVSGLRKQEAEKQGRFKLSYYCDRRERKRVVGEVERRVTGAEAPYRVIESVDPFTDDGLIDLLPVGVSKAYALDWLVSHVGHERDRVVFAGDSGNDLAALTAGYPSIVVGNAATDVVEGARKGHEDAGWSDRLYVAERPATSGVLEGLRHYLTR